ncbi:PIG-L deacetylase family protein [Streptomyces acidiscabies]|uniref:PIG-L family deacetylase n=1 Tax=Streptomyces acidiscabies TaxID=42234 RepID=A0AAP6BEL8_9ACTN|nr:PIG-L family deacetylase [Streptomyces acidiscabies]MBZ3913507.1 PIG-L family deacetylase [Streptomyces acidiscabies]MDX2963344.1 PIG-L family deacetylase [Streptomyces acidiscabies]MDX3023078.1 PIG-L family deacetylase [Streptomyces acidiscabies]MDX3792778.1 PIG-L family deacetylase [Streptomyces acidiscabies]GAQ51273.1 2'-N-acetylparomamine deacetylase [Streptomyces acidiscabies]
MTEIPDTWYPMVLPHVETADGTLRFLGHQVEGYGHLSDRDTALLSRCDGSWPLAGFPEADRETIGRWRRHGLLLMAPPLPPGPPATEPPVIVSPHPDDAALALGGTVARQGARFLDVFSVETWTKDPYYAERPALTRRLLLDEEGVAARVLRARVELLGFVDAADRDLRRDRFFTAPAWSDGSVREEPQLFDALTERLAPLLEGAGPVYAPLGVGGHVDHVACREAVLELARTGRLGSARVAFYEDQPYSLFASAEETAKNLGARLAEQGLGGLRPELLPVDDEALITKCEALGAYRIQVRKGIIQRIRRHGVRLAEGSGFPAAERIWLMRPPTSDRGPAAL